MIAAIICFSISIIIAIWGITMNIVTKVPEWLLLMILVLPISIFGAAELSMTPTNKDVKNGKAHYVEQNHIEVVNGDTINNYKTYEIVWTENSK